MLARIRKAMADKDHKDQGFTLIELLVVMVIIGILAAIAIPVYVNQQTKGRQTAAVADATAIGQAIATYFVDGTGTLSAANIAGGGTTADGSWHLIVSSADVDKGKLSNGDTVVTSPTAAQTITSGSAFCVLVKTSNSSDKIAQVTSSGVTLVGSTAATCTAA